MHTMNSLENRLDAKSDLTMRKLDEILNGSNREERSNPRERSHQANDGDGAGNYAGVQQNSRANYEYRNREPPRTHATPETRLPTVPQVRLVPDLTMVSQESTMYASMFEPLNGSLETFNSKLSKSTERGERSRSSRNHTKTSQTAALILE